MKFTEAHLEAAIWSSPVWVDRDIQKVEDYAKTQGLEYRMNPKGGTITVYIASDTSLNDVINFDRLKSFRLDKRS